MTTSELVRRLSERDEKERNWLIRDALRDDETGGPLLSEDFRLRLQRAISTPKQPMAIPGDAWWAIDYHLDWIEQVLQAMAGLPAPASNSGLARSVTDADLVLAFGSTLILVEAKGKTQSWDDTQMKSKIRRLGEVLGLMRQGQLHQGSGVAVYFALTSLRPPMWLTRHPEWGIAPPHWSWFPLREPAGWTE